MSDMTERIERLRTSVGPHPQGHGPHHRPDMCGPQQHGHPHPPEMHAKHVKNHQELLCIIEELAERVEELEKR